MKKKPFLILLITLLLISIMVTLFSRNTDSDYVKKLDSLYKQSIPLIQPQELYRRMQEEDIILLDTRSPDEFTVSHISGARFINYDKFRVKQAGDIPKDSTIVIYCSVGYRSERIGEKLKKKGYTSIYNLYGGIFEWLNQGLPLENSNGPTTQIHGYSKEWGRWIKNGEVVYQLDQTR